MNKKYLLGICLLSFGLTLFAEDGSKLWLRQASCEKASVCWYARHEHCLTGESP